MKKIVGLSLLFSMICVSYSTAQVSIDVLRKQNAQEDIAPDYIGSLPEPVTSSFSQPQQGNGLKGIPGSSPQIVETPIDENSYILATNDELRIYLWGTINQTIPVIVNSEGFLLIPSIAMVDLRGLTLAKGKEKIKAALLKVYKKADITISLSKLHVFRTYITGDVKKPGAYLITGQARVSDLINIAGGFINEYNSRLRGIEVSNDIYPTRYADMALFLHGMTVEKNFYLVQGDRVNVRPRKEIIAINGRVSYPGVYDFVHGDRLGDILKAAGSFSRGADSNKVVLTRYLDNIDSLKDYPLSVADSLFEINADDRILVCGLPQFRVFNQVYLDGAVKWPGVYPIQKEKTTLKEVIQRAGGFTDDADLSYSKIIRASNRNINEKIVTWLKTFSTNDLFSIERSYLKSQILEDGGVVSLKLSQIEDSISGFILQDGDRIIIARRSLVVRVSGAVKFPGNVQYEDGKDYMYYINKAGGFSSTATRGRVKVLKNDVAILLKPGEAKPINPGDMIWVPENDNRQAMRNAVEILSIVASTATIIVSFFAIAR
jgi:protein involved in polysaccharide export with SLBB domain